MDTLTQKRYKELAVNICNLGIGEQVLPISTGEYSFRGKRMLTEHFITDPRVMAEVMRLVHNKSCEAWRKLLRQLMHEYYSHNMILTITATCVEILEE